MRSMLTLALLILALGTPAFASDGVLEINQTCAVNTGCFAGDTAGFPVTISASGSYRLTSNLVVPNENTSGIQVSTDDVGIDLNNFTIRGIVVCSGTAVACTPSSGTGSGVVTTSSALSGISVRNGSIRGMGASGVLVGVQSEVTNVRVRSNRHFGIQVGDGSTVSGNTAYQSGFSGIRTIGGSTVSGNTVYQSGNFGILAGNDSTVSGNTAYQNGFGGIRTIDGSTVSGNTTNNNGGYGINCQQSSLIQGNTIRTNALGGISTGFLAHIVDNSLDGNDGPGIAANDGSNISRNTVGAITPTFAGHPGITCGSGCAVYDNLVRNTSQAMTLGGGSRYGRNVLSLSPNPAVTGSGVSAGDNLCNGVGC